MIITTHKTKAFPGESARLYQFAVDGDTVRVWDSVAGYYTRCHVVSRRAQDRILAQAKKSFR